MSKKPETFTINIIRLEIQWLHRQLTSASKQAEAQLNSLVCGPQSTDKASQIADIQDYYNELQRLTQAIYERLVQGNKERLNIVQLRDDLLEASDLVGEDKTAINEIAKRLRDLPQEENYRITFDRDTAKLTLQMLEKDLTHFRANVIPGYEKKDESAFPDPIQTKTYWVNKAVKAKNILDGLKSKIEREL